MYNLYLYFALFLFGFKKPAMCNDSHSAILLHYVFCIASGAPDYLYEQSSAGMFHFG